MGETSLGSVINRRSIVVDKLSFESCFDVSAPFASCSKDRSMWYVGLGGLLCTKVI